MAERQLPKYKVDFKSDRTQYLKGLNKEFLPVGFYEGRIDGDVLTLDTIRHSYINNPAIKLDQDNAFRLRLIDPDDIDAGEDGRVKGIHPISATEASRAVFESIEYRSSTGDRPWVNFMLTGAYRAEIHTGLMEMARLNGVPAELRSRISAALSQDRLLMADVKYLIEDTAEAARRMDEYAIGNLGRDELLTDFVAIRIIEKVAPDIRSDRSLFSTLASHMLASHRGLGEYHQAIENIDAFLTDLVEVSSGEAQPIDRKAISVIDPVMPPEDDIFGYVPVAEMTGSSIRNRDKDAKDATERLGLDPDDESNYLLGIAYSAITSMVQINGYRDGDSMRRDYTPTELNGSAVAIGESALNALNEGWKNDQPRAEDRTKAFSLVLESAGTKRIPLIKALKALPRIHGLTMAKNTLEAAPLSVFDSDLITEIEAVGRTLSELGAEVRVRRN